MIIVIDNDKYEVNTSSPESLQNAIELLQNSNREQERLIEQYVASAGNTGAEETQVAKGKIMHAQSIIDSNKSLITDLNDMLCFLDPQQPGE